jgi:hypothetical protein
MGQDALSAVSDGRDASSGQEERHGGRDFHGREEARHWHATTAGCCIAAASQGGGKWREP